MTDALPPLKEVIARYRLSAKKSLGQNFILDTNLLDKIARSAKQRDPLPFESGTVIEVGPGPGGVTRAILENGAKHLTVIEKDERCLGLLSDIQAAYPDRLAVLNEDALNVSAETLGKSPRAIIANLPYNVGTLLLTGWLKKINDFSSLTLMFQKEVAERLTAAPKSSAYGRLSILTQWLCETEILFTVPPSCFVPPPKVTSAVVFLKPRPKPLAEARPDLLEKVTAAAFNQRRKMLRSSLKSIGNSEALCAAAGIVPTARAEEIGIEAFCAMARFLEK
ncbi:MAG: 16S rRNA (adenine(1518)-N(6)/adenine(1519)-N(6))-dimethyltransferase RsmA [Alphaproteobacteria bacterium]|nr:16S rRNA (adenine(1518)-N(6)/adenine(1519)-N(6))-dimethyltransferase RsmA [Alphaproteobacteria bacterium]